MSQTSLQIAPLACQENNFRRPFIAFPNARSALKAFLEFATFSEGEKVLLPAYIGWTEREGSGVFDPIAELGLEYAFYRVDENLHIDIDDLRHQFETLKVKVFIIIHYFGHVDPAYNEVVNLARDHGALVMEDEAHALFTDLIGGNTGRLGDACIFSLHKMLPLETGGLLLWNNQGLGLRDVKPDAVDRLPSPWEFDLKTIAERRRRNAQTLLQLIEQLEPHVTPLWPNLKAGEVPQTLPIRVKSISRDQLYFAMRERGYGLVSLYYRLIDVITPEEYPESHRIAQTITNLPVHQEITPAQLEAMVATLAECIHELSTMKGTY